MDDAAPQSGIDDEAALRELYKTPGDVAKRKVLSSLDKHCRHFISLSPFLCISTAGADGAADVSPRGDAPGFVTAPDDRTVVIPDRPGNNRLDTMGNIVENPNVGLIFFIPGFNDILRINGRARIVDDEAVLGGFAVDGKIPKTAIVVSVDEAFLHCPKALLRSKLWSDEVKVPRTAMPTAGQIYKDQIALAESAEELEEGFIAGRRKGLY
ncbi:MAG: pyridoxamine 5'-phosphate oxidase family protein [Alphaproteobacteria bacterium]|nr:pyridoxamine 5'-phosphate oxidase family protein [Alphaproteobacteria bacterium]